MTTTHIVPFDFTASYASAVVPVGSVHTVIGSAQQTRKYVFGYNAGADAIAAGDVVGIFSAAAHTFGSISVTAATIADFTDGTTTRAWVGGVAGAACVTTTYCWLWFAGYGTHDLTTSNAVAIYNGLICANGAKVATPNTTAATAHWAQFGIATATDVGTTLNGAVLGGDGMFPWDG